MNPGAQPVLSEPRGHEAAGTTAATAGESAAQSVDESQGWAQAELLSTGTQPEGPGRLGRVPGVPPLTPPQGQPETLKEIGKRKHRQVLGCLRRAERQWTDVESCLCDQHGQRLQKLKVRASQHLQTKSTKKLSHYQELFTLSHQEAKVVAEVYNPSKFTRRAQRFRLHPGQAFDLELGHDLMQRSAQHSVLTYIKQERPGLVVISPPCEAFSVLNRLLDKLRRNNLDAMKRHLAKLKKGKILLNFAMQVCHVCHEQGTCATFVFEHPRCASSWKMPSVQRLLRQAGVILALADRSTRAAAQEADRVRDEQPDGC